MLRMSFLNKFRRISSQRYIPEVDGLRFLAIMPVLIMHFRTVFFRYHSIYKVSETSSFFKRVDEWLVTGDVGVLVFFVISGFILSLPYAKAFKKGEKTIAYKTYLLRRLTRIEPPYFIVLILLFCGHLYINTADYEVLKSSFLASLFYCHNISYGTWSIINPVAWSLEIEIQFYLLVPFVTYLFKIKSNYIRHVLIVSLIFLFPYIASWTGVGHLSLLKYVQYFLAGFLVTDIYTSYKNNIHQFFILDFIGFISIILVFVLQYFKVRLFLPIVLSTLFLCVLYGSSIKKLFANKLLSTIGGMCYTTYLIHLPVLVILMSILDSYTLGFGFWVDFIFYITVIVPLTLIICSYTYLILEKPFMNKRWPQQFKAYILKR